MILSCFFHVTVLNFPVVPVQPHPQILAVKAIPGELVTDLALLKLPVGVAHPVGTIPLAEGLLEVALLEDDDSGDTCGVLLVWVIDIEFAHDAEESAEADLFHVVVLSARVADSPADCVYLKKSQPKIPMGYVSYSPCWLGLTGIL